MCGDAEPRSERNFYVRKVGSAVDAPCGIMVVTGDEEVNFGGGSGRELVAVMRDVIILCKLCNMAAHRNVKCLLKCVKRDEARGKNAVRTSLYNLQES